MKKLFENWRGYLKEYSDEDLGLGLDSNSLEKSVSGAIDKILHVIFKDVWRYSVKRACYWWGKSDNKRCGPRGPSRGGYEDHFDAHKHILAAALFTIKYNSYIARTMGDAREAWQSDFNPVKLDMMDIENNEIGISIGKKYSGQEGFDREAIDRIVFSEIKAGNFHGKQGTLKRKEKI
tara:strand:+ start:588 stop:1121 length:534 start_codon:yes stop_codon:yes gene_type:complete